MRTRRTIFRRKTGLDHDAGNGAFRQPRETVLTGGAGDDRVSPVDQKMRLVKTLPRPRLPTGIIGHGADDGHWMGPLTLQSHLSRRIPLVDKVFAGEKIALGERRLNDRDPVVIGCRCGSRFDVHDQVCQGGVAGFRQVNFITDPFHAALGAGTSFRIIR